MIIKLTTDIYRLQIPFSNIYTCMFLIRTPEGTVVYDTGTYSSDISNYLAPALQELGMEQPAAVVLSHNHGDHAGGLAAFHELYPDAAIYAGSEACKERVDAPVQVLKDGDLFFGLRAVHIPGHTADCTGIYDERSKTLLSADCLQAYGIYGKGKWGTSIPLWQNHLKALERLRAMDIEALYTAHHYEPLGNSAVGTQQVADYIEKCAQAIYDLREFVKNHPQLQPEAYAPAYAEETGLPIPPDKTFAAMLL